MPQPDGYTIMMGHMGTHGAAPALYPNLKYDPTKDFVPIGLAAGTPIVIVAKKDFPAERPEELHRLREGERRQGEHGACGRRLRLARRPAFSSTRRSARSRPLVAYRGTGPALNDLMANTVDFMTDQIVNVAPQIQGGNIKAYAIATPERSPALPNVPTTKEAGLADYQVSAWNAVFAPKSTPPEIVAKLSDALDKALDDENTRKRLLELGGVIPSKTERTPAALQKLVEGEVARWTPVLKAAGAVGGRIDRLRPTGGLRARLSARVRRLVGNKCLEITIPGDYTLPRVPP